MKCGNRRAQYVRVPLVAPSAIKAYMARALEDHRWIKQVPLPALRERVHEVLPAFRFATEPHAHQYACFLLGREYKRFLFSSDMGSGKSKIILDLVSSYRTTAQFRTLICVPYNINIGSWARQVRAHAPHLSVTALEGSREDRARALDEDSDIFVINYAGLHVYMAEAKVVKGRKSKKKMVDAKLAQDFASLFRFVVFDEAHFLTNPNSLTYKCADVLSQRAEWAYGLTGTPFDNEPLAVYPEFTLIDRGETFGGSDGMFKLAYFTPKNDYWSGIKWVVDKREGKAKIAALRSALYHRSIRYEDKELLDLPAITHNLIHFDLTPAQREAYQRLVKRAEELRKAESKEREAIYIRQRQITSGLLVASLDDTKVTGRFVPNPKIDALEQLLQEIPAEEKVVVFHQYTESARMIIEVLKRLKLKHVGVGALFSTHGVDKFMKDASVRVFVAQAQAGSTGVDGLQEVCRYAVFFESPSSPALRKQAEKRLHRQGQKRRVYVYDLVASKTVDVRVLEHVRKGIDLFRLIVDGKEK